VRRNREKRRKEERKADRLLLRKLSKR